MRKFTFKLDEDVTVTVNAENIEQANKKLEILCDVHDDCGEEELLIDDL